MAETIKTITDATWPKLKAKASEMGITPPATPTTWAKVHSEINGFAERAAAKVKALTPAVVVPAPAVPVPAPTPPPTPAPTPSTPPASYVFNPKDPMAPPPSAAAAPLVGQDTDAAKVAAVGKTALLGLRASAGATSAGKKNPRVDRHPNVQIDGPLAYIRGGATSQPVDLGGYDWSGLTPYPVGVFPIVGDDLIFGTNPDAPRNPFLDQRDAHPDNTVTLSRVTFDQWRRVARPAEWMHTVFGPAPVRLRSVRIQRIAAGFLNIDPGMDVEMTEVYCEAAGQNAYYVPGQKDDGGAYVDPDSRKPVYQFDHCEPFNAAGGRFALGTFLIDGRYNTGGEASHGLSGIGGLIQFRIDPKGGPAGDVQFSNGLIIPGRQTNQGYTFQLARGSVYPGRASFLNVAMRTATWSDGRPGAPFDDPNSPLLYGSGNVDLDTGLPLPGNVNRAA